MHMTNGDLLILSTRKSISGGCDLRPGPAVLSNLQRADR